MADDRDAMRKTILARIATRDTSIPNPTPEQFAETTRLLEGVLKSLGGKHKDYALMLKLLKDLRTRKGASKQPPAEPAEGSAEAPGDPRELQQDSRLANEIIREYEEYHNIRSQNKEEGR